MKHLNKAGLAAIFMFLSVLFVSAPTEAPFAEAGTRLPGGRLFEALALSEAQKAEIDSLTALSREHLRSVRGQLKEQREALRERPSSINRSTMLGCAKSHKEWRTCKRNCWLRGLT